jgi:hypothetical protein
MDRHLVLGMANVPRQPRAVTGKIRRNANGNATAKYHWTRRA